MAVLRRSSAVFCVWTWGRREGGGGGISMIGCVGCVDRADGWISGR